MIRARAMAVMLSTGVIAVSCAAEPEVALCLRTAPDDPDPLRLLDPDVSLLVSAIPPPAGGRLRKDQYFDAGTEHLRLASLDFGKWKFVVQALAGEEVIATGETLLLDVDDEHAELPCIYVATVGTFGAVAGSPPPATPRLAFSMPESSQALVATDDGLLHYDHETGELSGPTEFAFEPRGAVWAALQEGRAVAILPDPDPPVAVILNADGTEDRRVEIDAAVGGLDGATAVFAEVDRNTVLVVGGAADASALPVEAGSVRAVNLESGTVTLAERSVGLAVRDARVEPLGNQRFLVVGSNEGSGNDPVASGVVAIVHPSGGVLSSASLNTERLFPMVAVSGINVLVLGGLAQLQDGRDVPAYDVEIFRVARDQLDHRDDLDDPIRLPRIGGIALATPDEIVVAGGNTLNEDTDGSAEHVRIAEGTSICPDDGCDAPGIPLHEPVAVTLHDGSILVLGSGGAVVYRP